MNDNKCLKSPQADIWYVALDMESSSHSVEGQILQGKVWGFFGLFCSLPKQFLSLEKTTEVST